MLLAFHRVSLILLVAISQTYPKLLTLQRPPLPAPPTLEVLRVTPWIPYYQLFCTFEIETKVTIKRFPDQLAASFQSANETKDRP
jgi:hypothetical protein